MEQLFSTCAFFKIESPCKVLKYQTYFTMNFPSDQTALLELLSPLIKTYLKEANIPTPYEEYLGELGIQAISVNGQLAGFWALRYRSSGSMKLVTIKGFYLKPEFRGRYINKVADDLHRIFVKQGVTDIEIWNYKKVQRWFARRYKLTPLMYVSAGKIDQFKVYDD